MLRLGFIIALASSAVWLFVDWLHFLGHAVGNLPVGTVPLP